MTAAWIGFAVCLLGTVIAAVTILAGRASVLYTFYPPLLASSWYYAGVFPSVGGSMIWVVLMIINMLAWKRDNPGEPVPLAMFAITATALPWAWSASGVVIELLSVILPAAFGWATKMDAGLGRTLFSVLLATVVAGAFAVPAFAQDVASMACSDYAKLDDAGKMALMADLQSMNAEMASSQEVSSQDIASYLNTECASKPDEMLSVRHEGHEVDVTPSGTAGALRDAGRSPPWFNQSRSGPSERSRPSPNDSAAQVATIGKHTKSN